MEKSFQYIQNVSAEVGTIRLYGQIGESTDQYGNRISGISGSSFAYEMEYLENNCKKINVRINSIGGSVLDGYSIISSILNCKVPCDTYIDGLAASISGVVAVSGKKCYMADYGTLMLHNPSGGSDAKVLNLVKDTLVTVLSGRTKQSPEEIGSMMSKETWLGAKEALEKGMVDEIISSGKRLKFKATDSLADMALVYNKLLTNDKKQMEKVTNKLGIDSASTEEVIVNSIDSIIKERDELKNKVASFEAKELAEAEKAKTALKNKATELANGLETAGKIKAEEKASVIENASKDEASFEFVKNTFDKISVKKESVKVFDFKNVAGKNGEEDRTSWKFSDWSKKDPAGLLKIRNEFPELFNEMYNAEYKKG